MREVDWRAVAESAAAALCRTDQRPTWGVILGSGFGAFVAALDEVVVTPYEAIPGMPEPSVAGHRGLLHQGRLAGTPLVVAEGRLHAYEGHDPAVATFPVRLLAALGIRSLLLTNAAGGLHPSLPAGALMLIKDHLNFPGLTGANPLRGPPVGDLPRFVSMLDAYDPALRTALRASAERLGLPLHEGVYAMVGGPSYETPAELGFLRLAGADAVGMSTAGEAVVARQLGLRVLGLSCIANAAFGTDEGDVSHLDVLATVRRQVPNVLALFRDLLTQEALSAGEGA